MSIRGIEGESLTCMREDDIQYLVCPGCGADLKISSVSERRGANLKSAQLSCAGCSACYPVLRGIPRFVSSENYATGFGLEWTLHAKTQYDSYTGVPVSEDRFFSETEWDRDLSGEVILEVGSGSGRFTEPAASTGAFVVSLEYSHAVEANYQSNGHRENVLIVQADLYQMPFRANFFDRLFCFGVLQHTPDVKAAFLSLSPVLKPGGELVVDLYKKTIFTTLLHTKYYMRTLTKRMDPNRLYRLTKKWVDWMWPFCTQIRKIPRIGSSISWRLFVPDYSALGVPEERLKEWAYLDVFDMLAPRYDSPQTRSTLRRWFEEAGLEAVRVRDGHNGIEGRGRKPVCAE